MKILQRHSSPDGVLHLLVTQESDERITVGFENSSWRIYGEILSSKSTMPVAEAVARFIGAIKDDELPIFLKTDGEKILNARVQEDMDADIDMRGKKGEVLRYWSGRRNKGFELRALAPTIITCAIISILLSQRLLGYMLFVVAVPLLIWLVRQIWNASTSRVRRRISLIKMGVWGLGLAAIFASQVYMNISSRRAAQEVVNIVEAHIAKTGECPASLETLGFTKEGLRKKLGPFSYHCDSSTLSFAYVNPFTLRDMEVYNPQSHQWDYSPD